MYRMCSNPRGRAIIVNIEHFENLQEREGSLIDVHNLTAVLKDLHYDVHVWSNYTSEVMLIFVSFF